MPNRDIIVLGASAGGVGALSKIVAALPADLPAAVFIALHLSPDSPTVLPAILQRKSALPIAAAVDGAPIRKGTVTTAVSDRHLMLEGDRMRLTRGPRESRARPAIDVLFRSAAIHFGPRCIGVLLTGMLDDGTAGLWAIKDCGGIAVVQSPQEAEYPSMPASALKHVEVDHVARLAEMPRLLMSLASQKVEVAAASRAAERLLLENRIAAGEAPLERGVTSLGELSANTCPHCHGTLITIKDGSFTRYRCHTGHAFAPQSLLADLDWTIDEGLSSVMRAIDERLFLLKQLQDEAQANLDTELAQEYARQAEDARSRAADIRKLLLDPETLGHQAGGV